MDDRARTRFNLSLGNLAPRTAHTIDEYEGRNGPLQLRKRMRKERSFTQRHDTTLWRARCPHHGSGTCQHRSPTRG